METIRLKALIETRIFDFFEPFILQQKSFQILISSALWKIPQDVSQCNGDQSLQVKSTEKVTKSNFQVESSPIKKNNLQHEIYQETLYHKMCTRCTKLRNFSNNRQVTMLYSFLRWQRFNTSTFNESKWWTNGFLVSFTNSYQWFV